MKLPRLLIAAPGSSSGKTVVSLLLNAWARRQGLMPRAFKVGPDFIDPQYLSAVSGQAAINLDPWFLGPRALQAHFAHYAQGSRLAVVEGVMGLFDGKRGAPFGRHSSAELARNLKLPVVLVLNARKAGPTLATQALGLQKADPRLKIAGVLLNQVMGAKTVQLIAPALRKLTGLPVLGWLPNLPALSLPERHLGLTAPSELSAWQQRLEAVLPEAAKTLDFEALLRVATKATPLKTTSLPKTAALHPRFRLAVAKDEAFHFYYQENLDLLRSLGAALTFFSPLRDRCLPAGIQGLYVGGGFPESFAPALGRNKSLKAQVRSVLAKGLPIWAECGGLMWLSRSLEGRAMVGALPGKVRMTKGLQAFGYTQARPLGRLWGKALGPIKGHEFHHSVWEVAGRPKAALALSQTARPLRREGLALKGGLATYFHAYLPSNPAWARAFAQACSSFKAYV